jgi:hypothetical protein
MRFTWGKGLTRIQADGARGRYRDATGRDKYRWELVVGPGGGGVGAPDQPPGIQFAPEGCIQ